MFLRPPSLRPLARPLFTPLSAPRAPQFRIPSLLRQAHAKPPKRTRYQQQQPSPTSTTTSHTPRTINLANPAPSSSPLLINPRTHRFITLEEHLASLKTEKLLYSCENGPFRTMCAAFAMLGLLWSAHTVYDKLICDFEPDGRFKGIVVPATIFGVGLMGVFICVMMFYPSRLILKIRSIPDPRTNGILLELTKRAWILPQNEIITVKPSQLVLHESLRYEIPIQQTVYSLNPIYRTFQRIMSRQIWTFKWLRELISTEKFVQVGIQGQGFPLTINKHGWQWEKNGLERLIPMKARKKYE